MRIDVSVIIPNYNHATYLVQRIESVLNQTFQNIEVILLDDCSTDNSWDILSKYKDHPKVTHCIRNEVNSGSAFRQWKKGLDLAKGEWIWIAESDDYADIHFLERMLQNVNSNTNLIFCKSFNVDSIGTILGENIWHTKLNPTRWDSDYLNSGKNEICNYLLFRNVIVNASAVIFKKPIKFPSEIKNMSYAGDWYFWISILQKGDLSYISEPLNYMRMHDQSTRSFKSMSEETKRINEFRKTLLYAASFSNLKTFKIFLNPGYYKWIIADILLKSRKFGLFSTYAILPNLPFMLKPFYYLEWFKFLLMSNSRRKSYKYDV